MRHRGRPVTTHQHDSRETEPQLPKQQHELEPIKGQRRSGFCYYVTSLPHASVNIAKSDPNGASKGTRAPAARNPAPPPGAGGLEAVEREPETLLPARPLTHLASSCCLR